MPSERPADLPHRASVIVIGGGVIGCSVAYHLARAGVADVTLLERKQITSGTPGMRRDSWASFARPST